MAREKTDHETIRRWVEERGGWPARVKGTGNDDDPGLLRIDFPGFSGEKSLARHMRDLAAELEEESRQRVSAKLEEPAQV